ncbi:hypothetical protein BU17DRAFT_100181 [Hysterangium stoloniferum]|nr:hypothetical protein BU17DRAFT_100181 [Hysterangium stoloniferum]
MTYNPQTPPGLPRIPVHLFEIGQHDLVSPETCPHSTYVVPRGGAGSLKTSVEKDAFGREIQTWIQSKVARHKYLRGGVVVVDVVPKSAAGKILRKELRELARKDLHVTNSHPKL